MPRLVSFLHSVFEAFASCAHGHGTHWHGCPSPSSPPLPGPGVVPSSPWPGRAVVPGRGVGVSVALLAVVVDAALPAHLALHIAPPARRLLAGRVAVARRAHKVSTVLFRTAARDAPGARAEGQARERAGERAHGRRGGEQPGAAPGRRGRGGAGGRQRCTAVEQVWVDAEAIVPHALVIAAALEARVRARGVHQREHPTAEVVPFHNLRRRLIRAELRCWVHPLVEHCLRARVRRDASVHGEVPAVGEVDPREGEGEVDVVAGAVERLGGKQPREGHAVEGGDDGGHHGWVGEACCWEVLLHEPEEERAPGQGFLHSPLRVRPGANEHRRPRQQHLVRHPTMLNYPRRPRPHPLTPARAHCRARARAP
mmetsp:Transcript_43086/g.88158  ORF Transcript_43086/g.88158 Transcript_43086/m.88158 type:complete len:369 (+) Transcript_43086:3086-4192(+)